MGRPRRKPPGKNATKHPTAAPTICWDCRNAVPGEDRGCSWSKKGKPVPGWDAQRRDVMSYDRHGSTYVESYVVRACPEFING